MAEGCRTVIDVILALLEVRGVPVDEQSRAAIEVAMMEAMRKISLAPRCQGRGTARPM